MCISDGRTDGKTDRQTYITFFASAGCKNENIQIDEPTREILVIITFRATNAYSLEPAQMSSPARA